MTKKKWFQAAGLVLLCQLTISACQNKQETQTASYQTTSNQETKPKKNLSKNNNHQTHPSNDSKEKAVPGVTVPTSDGFILTDTSKILIHTQDGIVVDHDGHSHFIFYADLKGTKFAHLIPAGTELTKSTPQKQVTPTRQQATDTDHHYTFNPADIVAEDALGYTVRHEDHYHYILKSSLASQPSVQIATGGNSRAEHPVLTPSHSSHQVISDKRGIAGLDYPTSDGFLFDGTGVTGWTDLGLMVDHGGHLHLILKTDLAQSKWSHLLVSQPSPVPATPTRLNEPARPTEAVVATETVQPQLDNLAVRRAYLAAATGLASEQIVLLDTPNGPAFMYPHGDHTHLVLLSQLDITKPYDDGHGHDHSAAAKPNHAATELTNPTSQPVAPTVPAEPTEAATPTIPVEPATPTRLNEPAGPTEAVVATETVQPQLDNLAVKRAYLAAATGLTAEQIVLLDTPNGPAFMYPHGDHNHLVLLSQLDVTKPYDDGHGHDHSAAAKPEHAATELTNPTSQPVAPTVPAEPTEAATPTIPVEPATPTRLNELARPTEAVVTTETVQPQLDNLALKRAYLAAATGLAAEQIVLLDTPNGPAFMYPHGDHTHLVLLSQLDVTKPYDDGHGHDHSAAAKLDHAATELTNPTSQGQPELPAEPTEPTPPISAETVVTEPEHPVNSETISQPEVTEPIPSEEFLVNQPTVAVQAAETEVADEVSEEGDEPTEESINGLSKEPELAEPAQPLAPEEVSQSGEEEASEVSHQPEATLEGDGLTAVEEANEVEVPVAPVIPEGVTTQADDVALKRAYLAAATGLAEEQIFLLNTPQGPSFMYPHGDHHHVVPLSQLDVTKPYDDGHHRDKDESKPEHVADSANQKPTETGETASPKAEQDQPSQSDSESTTDQLVPEQPSQPGPSEKSGVAGLDYPTSDGFLFDGTGMAGWTSAGLLVNHGGHTHILPTEAIAKSKWAHLLPKENLEQPSGAIELSEQLVKQREELAKQLGLTPEAIRVVTTDGKVIGFEYPHEDHYDFVPANGGQGLSASLTEQDKRDLTAYIRKTYGLLLGTPVTFHDDFVVFAIPHPHQDYDVTRDYYSDVLDPAYDPGHVHPYAVPLSTLSIPKTTGIAELDFENELLLAAKRIGVAPHEVAIKNKKYFVLPGKDHDHYLNILTPVAGLDAYMANKLPDIKANFAVGDYSKEVVLAEADRLLAAAQEQFGDSPVAFRRVARALEAFKANLTIATTSTQGYIKALQSFENKYLKGLDEDVVEAVDVTPAVSAYLRLTERLKGYDERTLKNFGVNTEQQLAELKRLVAAQDEAGLAKVAVHFDAIDRTRRAANDLGPRLAYMDFFLRHVDSDKLPASLRQEVLAKLTELQKISGLYRNQQKFREGLASTALLKEKVKLALAAEGPAADHANWTPYPRGYDRREIVREVNAMREFLIKHKEVTAEELAEGFDKPLELFKPHPKKPVKPVTPPVQPQPVTEVLKPIDSTVPTPSETSEGESTSPTPDKVDLLDQLETSQPESGNQTEEKTEDLAVPLEQPTGSHEPATPSSTEDENIDGTNDSENQAADDEFDWSGWGSILNLPDDSKHPDPGFSDQPVPDTDDNDLPTWTSIFDLPRDEEVTATSPRPNEADLVDHPETSLLDSGDKADDQTEGLPVPVEQPVVSDEQPKEPENTTPSNQAEPVDGASDTDDDGSHDDFDWSGWGSILNLPDDSKHPDPGFSDQPVPDTNDNDLPTWTSIFDLPRDEENTATSPRPNEADLVDHPETSLLDSGDKADDQTEGLPVPVEQPVVSDEQPKEPENTTPSNQAEPVDGASDADDDGSHDDFDWSGWGSILKLPDDSKHPEPGFSDQPVPDTDDNDLPTWTSIFDLPRDEEGEHVNDRPSQPEEASGGAESVTNSVPATEETSSLPVEELAVEPPKPSVDEASNSTEEADETVDESHTIPSTLIEPPVESTTSEQNLPLASSNLEAGEAVTPVVNRETEEQPEMGVLLPLPLTEPVREDDDFPVWRGSIFDLPEGVDDSFEHWDGEFLPLERPEREADETPVWRPILSNWSDEDVPSFEP